MFTTNLFEYRYELRGAFKAFFYTYFSLEDITTKDGFEDYLDSAFSDKYKSEIKMFLREEGVIDEAELNELTSYELLRITHGEGMSMNDENALLCSKVAIAEVFAENDLTYEHFDKEMLRDLLGGVSDASATIGIPMRDALIAYMELNYCKGIYDVSLEVEQQIKENIVRKAAHNFAHELKNNQVGSYDVYKLMFVLRKDDLSEFIQRLLTNYIDECGFDIDLEKMIDITFELFAGRDKLVRDGVEFYERVLSHVESEFEYEVDLDPSVDVSSLDASDTLNSADIHFNEIYSILRGYGNPTTKAFRDALNVEAAEEGGMVLQEIRHQLICEAVSCAEAEMKSRYDKAA